MLYFVIKVKTYKNLPEDYTVVKVLADKDDAHTLAKIFTRIDNDPSIGYIVTHQDFEELNAVPI